MSALIVAVFLFVVTRLQGREMSSAEYPARRDGVVRALRGVLAGGEAKGLELEVEGGDVDAWIREIRVRGWTKLVPAQLVRKLC